MAPATKGQAVESSGKEVHEISPCHINENKHRSIRRNSIVTTAGEAHSWEVATTDKKDSSKAAVVMAAAMQAASISSHAASSIVQVRFNTTI